MPISDNRRGRLRDLYTINSDRGRGGAKIPKIRLTSFVHGPLPRSQRRLEIGTRKEQASFSTSH